MSLGVKMHKKIFKNFIVWTIVIIMMNTVIYCNIYRTYENFSDVANIIIKEKSKKKFDYIEIDSKLNIKITNPYNKEELLLISLQISNSI